MKTVNLELSKQLKEAGYPQESCFWWEDLFDGNAQLSDNRRLSVKGVKYWSSPTADEILEQLPAQIKNKRLQIDKMPAGEFCISYIPFNESDSEEIVIMGTTPTLADAAAKMWLYIKKEDLL